MTRQRIRRKNLDRIAHQRSKKRVETKLHLLKGKILPLKKLSQRKRINHRSYIRVPLQEGIDRHREVRLTEAGPPEGTRGHDESALHRGDEEYRGLRGGITDTRYREVEVDRGTIVMDHGVDYHRLLDAEDPILVEGQGHPGGNGTGAKDPEIVAGPVVERGVDLDDPP